MTYSSPWEAASAAARSLASMAVELPAHVWITEGGRRIAGLLVGWEKRPDGSWHGRVCTLDDDGDPAICLINADLLSHAGG